MEKIKNKYGHIISYREKVYVNGKAVSKTFKRKSDALRWKKNFSSEAQKRMALGIEDIQTIDFQTYSTEWLEMKKYQGLEPRTLDSYRPVIYKYLIPCLGKIKLERIRPSHAQKLIQYGRKAGTGTLRINYVLRILKQMLNDGVKLNYLLRNPLTGLKPLKMRPKSLSYWMPSQINQFLVRNKDDPHYFIYVLALNTGLRRGELLGLCWDKVNLEKRRIEISRIRDRYGLKDTTKTGLIRYIPLNNTAWEALNKLSNNKHHHQFVFALEGGALPEITHFSSRCFQKAVERAEVPRIRFHDLRTTYASNFVMAGGDIFALSKLLGHTSVEMTAKKYAALHPTFMKEVVHTVEFGGTGLNKLALAK